MGKAEKKIADWLFLNPGQLIPLSISELAEKCCCSEATIVRFAKRIGFGGYQELKISIAREEEKQKSPKKLQKTIPALKFLIRFQMKYTALLK